MRAICAGKQAGVIASLCWAVLYVQGVFDVGDPAATSELDVAYSAQNCSDLFISFHFRNHLEFSLSS